MKMVSRQRTYALLLTLGASFLLFRTLRLMFFEQGVEILVFWVIILTIVESIIDFSCIIGSLRWLVSNDALKATLALRLGAAAAIWHAIRVLTYVLGRTGPWVNFDVKQIYHPSYTFDWFWVWFAAILAALGVVGVIVIWRLRRRSRI
jgi:hypothetical protein